MIRPFLIACLLVPTSLFAEAPALPTQRIGQPLEIRDIYLAGAEVKPKPRRDREPPLVVRILDIKPAKDGSRYDFEVQGLEEGIHDLADYLEAPAGTSLPAIPLEITSSLPPGPSRPHTREPRKLPELGGYRTTMKIVAAAWLAGLLLILIWRKRKSAADTADSEVAPSLSERLRPLVNRAARGEITTAERARLERLIIGHWREKRPDIASMTPAEAMIQLRQDPESAPLFLALEQWLHARDPDTSDSAIEALLTPYAS